MKTHYTDTWGTFVGSQNCAEFLRYGVNHDAPYTDLEIEQCVAIYLNSLIDEQDSEGQHLWERFNFEWVAQDLIDLIHQSMT